MTTRTNRDANGIVKRILLRFVRVCSIVGTSVWIFGFVEFEAYLREIVEFGDGVAGDFGLDAAFEDTVEESVDVGFFGEVDERFAVIGCLDFFEVFHNLFQKWQRSEQTNFELLAVCDAIFLRSDEVEEDLGELVHVVELFQANVVFDFGVVAWDASCEEVEV